jgi:benzodiazapine receptor
MHPAILALLICAAAGVLEGALAGRGVRARFAELRKPRFSPPLTLWFVIGAAYYIICFALIYRLLASGFVTAPHRAALVLLLALMAVNAAWGFLFFRRKDLRASFLAFLPYSLIALALVLVLARIDQTSALVLTPYLVYLGYAAWWSYRLWALNRVVSAAAA